MSREVRRVPLDYKHPVKFNPYWRAQQSSPYGREKPASRLHAPDEMFVGLCGDYTAMLANWREELREVRERDGHEWTFGVEYHLTGYKGHEDTEATTHPFYTWSADGNTEIPVEVRDEDHLHELLLAQKLTEEPTAEDYMPVFDAPAESLGWCLYETVSEGTPVTPVFATAEGLIEHLATVGQDWDQKPLRRASAEAIVSSGGTFGSMVSVGGRLFDSTKDADALAGALGGDKS